MLDIELDNDAVVAGGSIRGRVRTSAALRSRVGLVATLDQRVWIEPGTPLELVDGTDPRLETLRGTEDGAEVELAPGEALSFEIGIPPAALPSTGTERGRLEWTVRFSWRDPELHFGLDATRPVTVLAPADAPPDPAPVRPARGWSVAGGRRGRHALLVDAASVARGGALRIRYAPRASRFRASPEAVEIALERLEQVAVKEGWAGPGADQPLTHERDETVVARRMAAPGEEVVLEVPADAPYSHHATVPIVSWWWRVAARVPPGGDVIAAAPLTVTPAVVRAPGHA